MTGNVCTHYFYTGSCLNPSECNKEHPTFKSAVKTKLKFKKNKEFVPTSYASVPNVSMTRNSNVCQCCGGSPSNCTNSEFCISLGACFCKAQKEIEELIRIETYEKSQVCECCKNDFDNCKDPLCVQLGMCKCVMKNEMENSLSQPDTTDDMFVSQYADCPCCHGFIYSCEDSTCVQIGSCYCML